MPEEIPSGGGYIQANGGLVGLVSRLIERQGANVIGWLLLCAILWYAGRPAIDNHFKFMESTAESYGELVKSNAESVTIQRQQSETIRKIEELEARSVEAMEEKLIPAHEKTLSKLDEIKEAVKKP